jgi:hypothetical protein
VPRCPLGLAGPTPSSKGLGESSVRGNKIIEFLENLEIRGINRISEVGKSHERREEFAPKIFSNSY